VGLAVDVGGGFVSTARQVRHGASVVVGGNVVGVVGVVGAVC
jgi:hypothetical protein